MSEENAQTPNDVAETSQDFDPMDEPKYSKRQMLSALKKSREEERNKYDKRLREQQESGFSEESHTPSSRSGPDFESYINKAAERAISQARELDRRAQEEKEAGEREALQERFVSAYTDNLSKACRDKDFKDRVNPYERDSIAGRSGIAMLAMEKPNDIQHFKAVLEWCAQNPEEAEELEIIASSDYARANKKLKKLMGSSSSESSPQSHSPPSPLENYTPSTTSKGKHATSVSELREFYRNNKFSDRKR